MEIVGAHAADEKHKATNKAGGIIKSHQWQPGKMEFVDIFKKTG